MLFDPSLNNCNTNFGLTDLDLISRVGPKSHYKSYRSLEHDHHATILLLFPHAEINERAKSGNELTKTYQTVGY